MFLALIHNGRKRDKNEEVGSDDRVDERLLSAVAGATVTFTDGHQLVFRYELTDFRNEYQSNNDFETQIGSVYWRIRF